ncbi:hypothetical protein [Peribacillus kribbensis]|uniref:hypothetical protein n=1 Tax=Peribacillus kribbensis TaxID=356658 RepID=UPI0003F69765|nr:hypothetical protein [Peribacillus kribbensis]
MWRLFCNTDNEGNITQAYFGEEIAASDPFTFFFLVDEEIANNIFDYKVQIVGFKTQLVKKEAPTVE